MPYIELQRQIPTRYVSGRTQAYRMVVETIDAQGISPKIFVYQRMTTAAGVEDVFQNIASPADLEEYPEDAPVGNVPFFRLQDVDLIFRNITLAEDAWVGIKNDVDQLIQTLEYLENLAVDETVAFGSSSSSSS